MAELHEVTIKQSETPVEGPEVPETEVLEETEAGISVTNEEAQGVDPHPDELEVERPDWLPDKFDNPEAMAEAYKNLEEKIGDPKPTEPEADGGPVSAEALTKFTDEFATNGELSEDSFTELEGMGLSRDLVTAFIQGQQAQQNAQLNEMYSLAGGQEAYNGMLEWAQGAMSPEEITAYNEAVESGDAERASMAIKGLVAQHSNVEGRAPNLLSSEPVGPGGPAPYESIAQMTEDMKTDAYKSDPAFRAKVAGRLAISDIMG